MTKLHEVLAVEADKQGVAKRLTDESRFIFKSKHQLFLGATKILTMDDAGHESLEDSSKENQDLTTTVPARLEYTAQAIASWLDVVAQKEYTNQTSAKADLVIDGEVLLSDVPATFLLGLESKLKNIREMYNEIPTLAQGTVWLTDETALPNSYRAEHEDIKSKTKKVPKSRVMYEATKEHPAQIEKWNEEVVVGKYTTQYRSGMISSTRKMQLLGQIDTLIQATKQARQRANNVDVFTDCKVGKTLFDFINK